MTAYQAIKRATEGYVTEYREDITVHDQKVLRKYKGTNFLYAIRPTGTNILPEKAVKSMTMQEFEQVAFFLLGDNERFFVYHGGNLREVSKQELIAKINDYRKKVGWQYMESPDVARWVHIGKDRIIYLRPSKSFGVEGYEVFVSDGSYQTQESFYYSTRDEAFQAASDLRDKYSGVGN